MMRVGRLELGMVVRYAGKLAEVNGISNGRVIHLHYVGEERCPTCGRPPGIDALEHAPLLQDKIEPVATPETIAVPFRRRAA
jgi:hypothetical protein